MDLTQIIENTSQYLIFSVSVVICLVTYVIFREKIANVYSQETNEMNHINNTLSQLVETEYESPLKFYNNIKDKLSPEQEQQLEKQVEQKQLEVIFKLLQEQEHSSQVDSMEQLQEQLSLYKK